MGNGLETESVFGVLAEEDSYWTTLDTRMVLLPGKVVLFKCTASEGIAMEWRGEEGDTHITSQIS